MRKILFRGQTRKYGERVRMGDGEKLPGNWVYGGVLQGIGAHSVIYGGKNDDNFGEGFQKWCVYTDTLGQYTGLTDKDGRKAFEHDVIMHHFSYAVGVIKYGEYRNQWGDDSYTGHVGFYVDWVTGEEHKFLRKDLGYWLKTTQIVGNIHDNPELMEVREDGKRTAAD